MTDFALPPPSVLESAIYAAAPAAVLAVLAARAVFRGVPALLFRRKR